MSERRKARFTWLAVAIVAGSVGAACHIFLDPDDLVSGNKASADGGGVVGPDGIAPFSDAGGSSSGDLDGSDREASAWTSGDVPACIPALPLGAQLVAVTGGAPGTPSACPSAYEATGQIGYGALTNTEFTCDPGTCGCGAFKGNTNDLDCTNQKVRYYSEPTCTSASVGSTTVDTSVFPFGDGCTHPQTVDGGTYAMITSTLHIGNNAGRNACQLTGDAGTTLQAPQIGLEVHLCRPTQPATATNCPGTDLPAVPANLAVACYISTNQNCDRGYDARFQFALAPDLSDTRSCSCECGLNTDGGSCSGGAYKTYQFNNCSGAITDGGTSTCHPLAEYGANMRPSSDPKPDPATLSCTSQTNKQGAVAFTSTQQINLCCLTPCASCQESASLTGGTCNSLVTACLNDADCKDYYTCAQKQQCGDNCQGCGHGGDSASKYAAIRNCLRVACPQSDCR